MSGRKALAAGLTVLTVCGLTACGTSAAASQGSSDSSSQDYSDSSSQASTPEVTATCSLGYVNYTGPSQPGIAQTFSSVPPPPPTGNQSGYSPVNYTAMQLVVTVGIDTQVNDFSVVFYDTAGNEITSATVPFGQLIVGGQTLTQTYDESMSSSYNPPQNAATCSVVNYQ